MTSQYSDNLYRRLLPPVAVFLKTGLRAEFWINVLLTILGWIPGILHAWWVLLCSFSDFVTEPSLQVGHCNHEDRSGVLDTSCLTCLFWTFTMRISVNYPV
ncbi:hypothetical protein FOMPIDRAFT_1120960 [Fomitopsis schrenkii]|uniref:Uncharacterized protein n=1 Tax=Fomitopsis schrenkii TaxID=2126942 RepID=S8FSS6_FOMSC|nr:hypothetical protein FOMPIDRAFT_1120960 [Fomitopsis schrenkii]